MTLPPFELNKLLIQFKDRISDDCQTRWSWQRYVDYGDTFDLDYVPWTPRCPVCSSKQRCEHKQPVSLADLKLHFAQKPWSAGEALTTYTSISIAGEFYGRRVKWLCIDMDSPFACEIIRSQLIPVLIDLDIDFIWERSGDSKFEKGHLWVLMDCTIMLQRTFFGLILKEVGLENWQEMKLERAQRPKESGEQFAIEFYPYQYDKNMIRLPGTIHQKTGKTNPIFFNGEWSTGAIDILNFFIAAKVLDTNRVVELIDFLAPKLRAQQEVDRVNRSAVKKAKRGFGLRFKYEPVGMPLPSSPVPFPESIKTMGQNCPAINKLLHLTFEEKYLDTALDANHRWGLWLDSMCAYDDIRAEKWCERNGQPYDTNTSKAKLFDDYVYETFRSRDESGHNWHSYKEQFREQPHMLIAACDKWARVFGMCKDCKFKSDPCFVNPQQFVTGETTQKRFEKKLILVSNEYIRETVFPEINTAIADHISMFHEYKDNIRERFGIQVPRLDLVLTHHQGSGKSEFTDNLLIRLSSYGRKSLLATPDSTIALQHYHNLKQAHVLVTAVFSHKTLFSSEVKEELDIQHNCPFYEEIQKQITLGLPSNVPKNKYCKRCSFNEECQYPRQYQELNNTRARVVIIQHAHLECKEALLKILANRFDFVTIDETFLSSCFTNVRISGEELKVLWFLARTTNWLGPLHAWVSRGGYPTVKLDNVSTKAMQEVLDAYEAMEMPWKFPDLFRAYTNNDFYDPVAGVEVFNPIPRSKATVRMFTDATAPLDMLKVILNSPHAEVLGSDLILHPKIYHPENEHFQVLDATTSRHQMSQDNYLETLLRFECELMKNEYQERTALITVFKDQIPRVNTYIDTNYPEIKDRVLVKQMQKGTNEHQDREVQFLNASVYPNGRDIAVESYVLSRAWNHWIRFSGSCLGNTETVDMLPQYNQSKSRREETEKVDLVRNELIDGNGYRVAYTSEEMSEPTHPLHKIIVQKYRAIKGQANRMRYRPKEFRHVWDFDKTPTNHLVTKSFRIAEILNKQTDG